MSRYMVIVNPISGRGNGERIIPSLETNLRELGLDFTLVQTERPFHATELALQAAPAGFDVVVGVGGDGTANEIINGLMQAKQNGQGSEIVMGVLPAGRGNDFAFSMNMPAALDDGCRILAEGWNKPIDVGWVQGSQEENGRFFGNSIGIGFDAVVSIEALKMTRLTGFASYLAAVFKTIILNYHAPHVEILLDGQVLSLPALMVSIMNGRRQGGAFHMSPQAQNDDGLFDLCIAEDVSRLRILTLIPHFLRGTQYGQKEIRFLQTNRLEVTAVQGTLPTHCDGEIISTEGTRLVLKLHPRQINVIGPRPEQADP